MARTNRYKCERFVLLSVHVFLWACCRGSYIECNQIFANHISDVYVRGGKSGFFLSSESKSVARLDSGQWNQVIETHRQTHRVFRSRFQRQRRCSYGSRRSRELEESRLPPVLRVAGIVGSKSTTSEHAVSFNNVDDALQPVRNEDTDALLAFKAGIVNDPYDVLSSWNELDTTPCVNWIGVTCNSTTGRVQSMKSGPSLIGKIAPELGNLSMLTSLDLSHNKLTGQIPPNLGSLRHLETLDLSFNSLTGEIPHQLGSLLHIRSLFLCQNSNFNANVGLSGSIPSALGNMSELQHIRLEGNSFSGSIPSSLANCTQLVELDFSYNRLIGSIPSNFFQQLRQLGRLDLSFNSFSGPIPADIRNLASLSVLRLYHNKFAGALPDSITNCTKLIQLTAGYSASLSWVIPCEIGQLQNLEILELDNMKLSGSIPASLSNCTALTTIFLSKGTSLSGNVPAELGRLSYLSSLEMGDNSLTGSIPHTLANCTNLRVLRLSNNQFISRIPPGLGNHIYYLYLGFNMLTGEIPSDLLNSSSGLYYLDLSGNNLTGQLPRLATNGGLGVLHVGDNFLSGEISFNSFTGSCAIGAFTSLRSLVLKSNHFSGSLPNILSECCALELVDLSNNGFSGPLPPSWNRLHSIRVLVLSSNHLTGAIPLWLGSLPRLQIFHVSHNSLTGTIPAELAGLLSFRALNLSATSDPPSLPLHNVNISITGEGLVRDILNARISLDLSSNSLVGIIPPQLASLTGIVYLNLSRNNLTGIIPHELANLSLLERLDLSNNFLSGMIPSLLVGLLFLSTLNLENNSLSGPIPRGLQFETFENSSYRPGNPGLCGKPLPSCSTPHNSSALGSCPAPSQQGRQQQDIFMSLPGFEVGVVVGFLSVILVVVKWEPAWIFVRHPWRERTSYHIQYGVYSSPA